MKWQNKRAAHRVFVYGPFSGAVGMVSEPPANRSCMENIIYLLSHLVTRHKKGGGSAPGILAAAKTSARLRRRFLHVI